MLKTTLFDCAINEIAVLTVDEAFALFFRPHPGGFDSLIKSPWGGGGWGAGRSWN